LFFYPFHFLFLFFKPIHTLTKRVTRFIFLFFLNPFTLWPSVFLLTAYAEIHGGDGCSTSQGVGWTGQTDQQEVTPSESCYCRVVYSFIRRASGCGQSFRRFFSLKTMSELFQSSSICSRLGSTKLA
jgi:hypothetical protein